MSKYLDEAIKLRARTDRHYNCAQAIFVLMKRRLTELLLTLAQA